MLTKLHQLTDGVASDLEAYRFAEAYEKLYHTIWDDFADWYIEASKTNQNAELLVFALTTILKAAHPFAPFLTETIWQQLELERKSILAGQKWPKVSRGDEKQAGVFEEIKTMVSEIRQITSRLQTSNTTLYHSNVAFIADNQALIKRLSRLRAIESVAAGKGLHLTSTTHDCWLDIDHDLARAYTAKLKDQAASEEASIARLKGRLSNKSYVQNAPEALVTETKEQLKQSTKRLEKISAEIAQFSSL
jgi:valyl-tRNA synthetase